MTTSLTKIIIGPNSSGIADVQAGSGNSNTWILESPDVAALRDGTNAWTAHIYNTYTNASNYERFTIDWQSVANVVLLGTEELGTGVAREMRFETGGVEGQRLDTSQRTSFGGFASISVEGQGSRVQSTSISSLWILGLNGYDTSGFGPGIQSSYTRNADPSVHSIVHSGDFLTYWVTHGSDGTAFRASTQIASVVDGSPGAGHVPGKVVTSTADTGGTMRDATIVDNIQRITLGGGTGWSGQGNVSLTQGGNSFCGIFQLQDNGLTRNGSFCYDFDTIIYGNSSTSVNYRAAKTRGGSPTTLSILQVGDIIFNYDLWVTDGTVWMVNGGFKFTVEGTPAVGNIPLRWQLLTGTNGQIEALRVDSQQQLFIVQHGAADFLNVGGACNSYNHAAFGGL